MHAETNGRAGPGRPVGADGATGAEAGPSRPATEVAGLAGVPGPGDVVAFWTSQGQAGGVQHQAGGLTHGKGMGFGPLGRGTGGQVAGAVIDRLPDQPVAIEALPLKELIAEGFPVEATLILAQHPGGHPSGQDLDDDLLKTAHRKVRQEDTIAREVHRRGRDMGTQKAVRSGQDVIVAAQVARRNTDDDLHIFRLLEAIEAFV